MSESIALQTNRSLFIIFLNDEVSDTTCDAIQAKAGIQKTLLAKLHQLLYFS